MTDETNETTALPALSDAELADAQKQGVADAVAENAKTSYLQNNNPVISDDAAPKIVLTNDALQLEYLLDYDPELLSKTLKGEGDMKPIPTQGQIASLLEMECSGKNRQDVIETLCDILGIKSPREVTAAGPGYANVVSRKAYADVPSA